MTREYEAILIEQAKAAATRLAGIRGFEAGRLQGEQILRANLLARFLERGAAKEDGNRPGPKVTVLTPPYRALLGEQVKRRGDRETGIQRLEAGGLPRDFVLCQ